MGQRLRRDGLATALIDCSDGLWPSLAQLGRASGVRMVVALGEWTFHPDVSVMAGKLGVDPCRLALGWGDWQLVMTCSPRHLPTVRDLGDMTETPVHLIGHCEAGSSVIAVGERGSGELLALDSERFAEDSWFSSGLDGYIAKMLEAPLWS